MVRAEKFVNAISVQERLRSYFAILKRSVYGTYHHVSQQHLKRYLGEADFRYNERSALGVGDAERAVKAIAGAVGKRVTYQETNRVPF